MIFFLNFLLFRFSFLYSASLGIPPYINPLALTFLMFLFLINPFKVFRHEARFWLLRISVSFSFSSKILKFQLNQLFFFQFRMVAAPFFHVGFADFWLADQFNSLVTALLDYQFLICFYITNGDWLEARGLL